MRSGLSICQVSAAYYPYPSGLSEHVHHLSRALCRRGHQVEILTTAFGSETIPEANVTRFGRAFLLPANKSYATVPLGWNMSGRVKSYLQQHTFDIVHLHGILPPEISFWALHHSRAVNVVTFHSVGFRTSRLAALLCRTVLRRWNQRLHGRIVESQAALRFTRPYFPGEYRVIPPGVDIERFRSKQGPVGATILFVGRLDERKGLTVLLRALPEVRKAISGVRLVVVGRGPMRDEAQRIVRRLGIQELVDFRGFVPNEQLPEYYARADIFCAPSLGGEAFGIVLLEAMASGLPVVASDISGYNEVVRDEENGLLVSPGNPADLAAALCRLLTDHGLRQQLGQTGRQYAEQHSWQNIAERIEGYYFELLQHRK